MAAGFSLLLSGNQVRSSAAGDQILNLPFFREALQLAFGKNLLTIDLYLIDSA